MSQVQRQQQVDDDGQEKFKNDNRKESRILGSPKRLFLTQN